MRRQNRRIAGMMVLFLIILAAIVCILFLWPSGPERLVDDFYAYESEAEFGKSWDLLSAEMKLRFPDRADYVQNRAHVFLQHMDVETFQYEVGRSKKVKDWSMGKGGKVHKKAYRVPVTQVFESQYGIFTIEQDCYVVKEKGEWRLFWDYRFE
ncbi:hypothetical protein ACQKL0_05830 [Peribacillus sp. NPDC097264]|uniref:hypothetical protein n=1 Tax=Peribacillus sp. NPDC097264 TaxID=3390616 RepID=UPI003CFCEFB0